MNQAQLINANSPVFADANIATINTAAGQTIDGAGNTRTIIAQNALLRFISNGQGWYIV